MFWITLNKNIPVYTKSYRYLFVYKQAVKREVSSMLEQGILRPSSSAWSSLIWFVQNRTTSSELKKWRMVVGYPKVKKKTEDDRNLIPNINDVLDKLQWCNYFTTVDKESGFHQIELEK